MQRLDRHGLRREYRPERLKHRCNREVLESYEYRNRLPVRLIHNASVFLEYELLFLFQKFHIPNDAVYYFFCRK